ncbi:MAG: MBL fold metallo-hydrolase [Candidatus Heimdallarchaeota archaeon]|nr:MBL fold metallo-hydrolase [Candidatus Heimdallarchaeota archaeon]
MTAIRKEGKVNENATLIDFKYEGAAAVGGVYFVEAGKTCLIDSGCKDGAKYIIKSLKTMNKFPPDYVILTHSHWDHSQGLPIIRRAAEKLQKSIEVFASKKAIPLLESQTYNEILKKIKFENITDISPLKEGDSIDLEGLNLKVIDVPGHNLDHIALYDEKTRNIFVGDSIGIKIDDRAFLSPIMPPNWNESDYLNTIDKLKQIKFESISLAHYGYIFGEEAQNILHESQQIFELENKVYKIAEKEGKLDDINYLVELAVREMNPIIPDLKLENFFMRSILSVMNSIRGIVRKKPITVGDIMLKQILETKVKGYKISKGIRW